MQTMIYDLSPRILHKKQIIKSILALYLSKYISIAPKIFLFSQSNYPIHSCWFEAIPLSHEYLKKMLFWYTYYHHTSLIDSSWHMTLESHTFACCPYAPYIAMRKIRSLISQPKIYTSKMKPYIMENITAEKFLLNYLLIILP